MIAYICLILPAALMVLARNFWREKNGIRDQKPAVNSVLIFFASAILISFLSAFILKIGFTPKFDPKTLLQTLGRDKLAAAEFFIVSVFLCVLAELCEFFLKTGKPRRLRDRIFCLLLIEGMILAMIAGTVLLKRGETRTIDPVVSGVMREEDGMYVLPKENVDGPAGFIITYSYNDVPQGTYVVVADYLAQVDQEISFSAAPDDFLKADTIFLSNRQTRVVFYLTLTHPVRELQLSVNYNGTGNFSIKTGLSRSRIDAVRNMVTVILCFTVPELALVLFTRYPEKRRSALAVAGIAAAAFIPYMLSGIHIGHDFYFHFMRIEGLADAIRNGQFPVYYQPLWSSGYGSPVSMYYGDILLYIPALFRLAGFTFNASYKIYVFFINLLTACISFYSFRKMFKNRTAALVCAFAYTCAPYRLIDIYVRMAVGEYSAAAFLPLAAAGYYGIWEQEKDSRDNGSLLLAAGMTGLILTHVLTTEMSIVILLLVTLILHKRMFSFFRVKKIAAAAVMCVLMSLFYLVPFLDSYRSNETVISRRVENLTQTIQSGGLQPGELFTFFKNITGLGFSDINDRMYLSVGLTSLLALAAALVLIFRKKSTPQMCFYTGFSLFCLWLSSNLFPWDSFAYYTRIGSALANMQYSWRYLIIASLFAALALGEVLIAFSRMTLCAHAPYGKYIIRGTVCFVCFLVFLETAWITSSYDNNHGRKVVYNTNEFDIGAERLGSYRRYGMAMRFLQYRIEASSGTYSDVSRRGTEMTFRFRTDGEESQVTVPIFNYKGWKVRGEYGTEYEIVDGFDKEISFFLPPDYDGIIRVTFEPLWYWTAALCISAVFWLCLIIACVMSYRRRKKSEGRALSGYGR